MAVDVLGFIHKSKISIVVNLFHQQILMSKLPNDKKFMRRSFVSSNFHPRKYYAVWLHQLIIVIWEISKWCSEILSTKTKFAPLLAFSINKFCSWNWRIIKKQHGVVLSQVTMHPKNYYAILLCSCYNHLAHQLLMFWYIIDTSHISILDSLFHKQIL